MAEVQPPAAQPAPSPAGFAGAGEALVWPSGAPAGERSTTAFDSYRRATDTMRDTAKWVVSFVPGAGLIVTLAAVVPGITHLSAQARWAPLALLAAAAVFVAIALVYAARVLAAAPPQWMWVTSTYANETAPGAHPGPRSLSTELDSEGFLHLYGYDSSKDFFAVVAALDMTQLKFATGPASTVLDFAAFRTMRGRFVAFTTVGVLAAIVAVCCVVVAQVRVATAPTPLPSINAPLQAVVVPTAAGVMKLRDKASCHHLSVTSRVQVWVVAGNLGEGTIAVDDRECAAARLTWSGATDGVVIPAPAR